MKNAIFIFIFLVLTSSLAKSHMVEGSVSSGGETTTDIERSVDEFSYIARAAKQMLPRNVSIIKFDVTKVDIYSPQMKQETGIFKVVNYRILAMDRFQLKTSRKTWVVSARIEYKMRNVDTPVLEAIKLYTPDLLPQTVSMSSGDDVSIYQLSLHNDFIELERGCHFKEKGKPESFNFLGENIEINSSQCSSMSGFGSDVCRCSLSKLF